MKEQIETSNDVSGTQDESVLLYCARMRSFKLTFRKYDAKFGCKCPLPPLGCSLTGKDDKAKDLLPNKLLSNSAERSCARCELNKGSEWKNVKLQLFKSFFL